MVGAESPASIDCDKGSKSRSVPASLVTVKLALLQPLNMTKTIPIVNHCFCISSLAGGSIDEASASLFNIISLLSHM